MAFSCPSEPLSDFMNPLCLKAARERIPLYCNFALTHRCSFRCQHCYLGDQHTIRRHKKEELPTDEVLAILDQLIEAGTLFLTLTGGDPLIREDFAKIYTHAVRGGLLVTVYCNGSLIDESIISLWKQFPPHMVEVSMYGATVSTFETVTQTRGSFNLFQQGIKRLDCNGIRYRLKTVLLTSNQHELEQMETLAEDLGVDFRFDPVIFPCMPCQDNNGLSNIPETELESKSGFSINKLFPGDGGSENTLQQAGAMLSPLSLRLPASEIVKIDLATEKRRKSFLHNFQESPSPEYHNQLIGCAAGMFSCHITPYGLLTPCIVSFEPACSLRKYSFKQAWDSSIEQVTQIKLKEGDSCYNCECRQLCCACPSLFVLETGNYRLPSSTLCEVTKKRFYQLHKLNSLEETQYDQNNYSQ